ncbi:MAG TPA: 4-hydroxy-3-methylbut-2-en-1-yl diphosphate synthase [Armatimonadetes bacterium]|nr:4-hydroxy-3-methylbut-2-en-1-yl diphosphate synthase [Armatimonadota bacterium]
MPGAFERRATRQVRVGDVTIGGEAPIRIQTMTNTPTADVAATLAQVHDARAAGADIVRVAIPDMAAADALREVVADAGVPVVADVHFDYRLAVAAAGAGAHKLRINPGNIGDDTRLRPVVEAALDRGIPIRVGVNAGSLEKSVLERHGHPTPAALAESALYNVDRVRDMGLEDIVVSIKASDVLTTLEANRAFAAQSDLPLHLGITEAGIGRSGIVHSSVGLGLMLAAGIGDTVRVSLTGDLVQEVRTGRDILLALGLASGPRLVSCPTCGRCHVDLHALATQVQTLLEGITAPVTVAVMGCEVNGPGEAKEADVGIAAGRGRVALFRRGEVVKTVGVADALAALGALIEQVCEAGLETE